MYAHTLDVQTLPNTLYCCSMIFSLSKTLRKQYEQMLNKSVRLLIFQFQMPHINRHLMLHAAMLLVVWTTTLHTSAVSSESLATFFPFRFTGLPWSCSHDSWWDSGHRLSLLHLQPPGLVVFDDTQEFTVAPKRPRILSRGWFRVVSIDLK